MFVLVGGGVGLSWYIPETKDRDLNPPSVGSSPTGGTIFIEEDRAEET
jgi:hypothetical protein